MQRAKRHVETKYAVVGSWEDTNVTLTVLEHYIPRFFAGAADEFYSMSSFSNRIWILKITVNFYFLQNLKSCAKQIATPSAPKLPKRRAMF